MCVCYAKRKDQLKWSKQEALTLQRKHKQRQLSKTVSGSTTDGTAASAAAAGDNAAGDSNQTASTAATKKPGEAATASSSSLPSSMSARAALCSSMNSLFINAPTNSNILLNQFNQAQNRSHAFELTVSPAVAFTTLLAQALDAFENSLILLHNAASVTSTADSDETTAAAIIGAGSEEHIVVADESTELKKSISKADKSISI